MKKKVINKNEYLKFKEFFLKFVENKKNRFHPLVWINGKPEIGKNVYIGGFSEINSKGAKIKIGRNCDIASFVSINVADSHLKTIRKAKKISKKNILIAGSLPAQNDTYQVDLRDKNIIEKNFYDQAKIINPYIDFFYLDVISSAREVEIGLNAIKRFKKPVLVGLHIKKNNKLASGETLTEVIEKNLNNDWLGVIGACVSLEIIESTSEELKKLNLPFGFKANLWSVEEPLPVHQFNKANYDEVGKNPNITLGKREDITGDIFCNFAKKIVKNGATILGGCCETNSSHIKEISKLK